MIRTGLLGGSFNPAHGGHRAISLFAMGALELDELWWLVSPGNPLKPKEGMAPLKQRLASACRMAKGTPIRPPVIERQMVTRYPVDPLKKLVPRPPNTRSIRNKAADNPFQFIPW